MADGEFEGFVDDVLGKDTTKRLAVAEVLVTYLQDHSSPLPADSALMDRLVDGLAAWLNTSNFKICLNGMEVISHLIIRLKEKFRHHINTVLPPLIDRLGDSKDQVREQAQELILRLMEPVSSPQYVFERMMGAFGHRNFRVREEVLICLVATINTFGAGSLTLSKIVPHICKLLGDPNSAVRDMAINSLVEIYRHVGEKVRVDLSKKGIPSSRLSVIFQKFDEVKQSGRMLAVSSSSSLRSSSSGDGDETDSAKVARMSGAKRVSSAPPRRPASAGMKPPLAPSSSAGAGGADEEMFIKYFEEVPKINLFSPRDLEDHMQKIKDTLGDDKCDWEQRVDSIKKLRSLLVHGAMDYDNFLQQLKLLEPVFKLAVRDLRSQVVREACITLSYLAQRLQSKFDHFAEVVMPNLFNLIPNSAKIMATAGAVTCRFIIQYTHAHRLIPIITSHHNSKSVAIRRKTFELLDLLLRSWETNTLEKHSQTLVETIKNGIGDADSEARVDARKCFWAFKEHYPNLSENLLKLLTPAQKKVLLGSLAHSSSSDSLATQSTRLRASSSENVRSVPGSARRTHTAPCTTPSKLPKKDKGDAKTPAGIPLSRSRSDIDMSAASRAKTRLGTGMLSTAHMRAGATASLGCSSGSETESQCSDLDYGYSRAGECGSQSAKKKQPGRNWKAPRTSPGAAAEKAAEARGRQAGRQTRVSQSQRRSRSCSAAALVPKLKIVDIDISSTSDLATSRERRLSESSGGRRPVLGPAERRPVSSRAASSANPPVTALRVLGPGKDVEAAVADALYDTLCHPQRRPMRRRYDVYSDDDDSEICSVSSDKSNGSSYGRQLEQQDIAEILNKCGSTSWAERKDGLLGLQAMLRGNQMLSRAELKRVTELFNRMFADPHGKVFSLFLETLVDLLMVHKADLTDWLYVLLTQLLKKLGADLLGSVQAKVQKALDTARDSFPYDVQFNILMRFIVDQTQTPNLKVKVALLRYMEQLIVLMDPQDFINSSETRLAVSRIITWTTEPKSVEVRKAASAVLIGLFELNTPEFSMMLSVLPKTFQDGATKLLHNHLRNTSNANQGSPRRTTPVQSPRSGLTSPLARLGSLRNASPAGSVDYDAENMNSEEIYNSLRQTTAEIQNYNFHHDDHEPIKLDKKKDSDEVSGDSGITSSMPDIRSDSPDAKIVHSDHAGDSHSKKQGLYNPTQYQDENNVNAYNRAALAEATFDEDFSESVPLDQSEMIAELLRELSNHDERQDKEKFVAHRLRVEERKSALQQLIKLTREDAVGLWDEHFKTILLMLLETMGDREAAIRALSLRALREILRNQPARFKSYAELTIMKILEAHKDVQKEVVRAAEETCSTAANSLQAEQCVRVLCPIVQTAEYPINLAAIKMLTKVVEMMAQDLLSPLLDDIMPGLLQGYDNQESSVRKASVFALVALHTVLGDELKPHLSSLTGSKMKLAKPVHQESRGRIRQLSFIAVTVNHHVTMTTVQKASPSMETDCAALQSVFLPWQTFPPPLSPIGINCRRFQEKKTGLCHYIEGCSSCPC
ncbi:PREDICTED: CLIP-associating protein 1-B-like isoform X2 [Branchiostoma belcheri]|uniref:CLIP-associating protein 1-B-like isoform X2 n=1 Tax=Branchiostoma belcheri TaxID=7741 RepID=A0A6P4YKD9_BRABE|nr:PREDICTED: CLIP-associating protein 1-B-like isoform X2 [Branchiostoma belcheri]